jgi:hypothetical protein
MKKRLLLILFLPGVTCGAFAKSRAANFNERNPGKPAMYAANAKKATNNTAAPIKGTVRDASGQPLPGVSVTIKGSTKGAQTDANGQFTIDANIGDVLVFSYVGYNGQELKLVSPAQLSITLTEDSQQLSEVVVTALGIKKERRSLGYSVTEVKGEDLTKAREPSFMNSLVGKVAGLNVSSLSGGPGASTNVTIRGVAGLSGNTQPLYVINGVPVESSPGGLAGSLSSSQPQTIAVTSTITLPIMAMQ